MSHMILLIPMFLLTFILMLFIVYVIENTKKICFMMFWIIINKRGIDDY